MKWADLPWPPSGLSPNARMHHMALHRLKKAYAEQCTWACITGRLERPEGAERLNVRITFIPPDRRKRDIDNMLASCKAGLDAVARYVGVDDSKWTLTLAVGEPLSIRGKGIVHVALEAV